MKRRLCFDKSIFECMPETVAEWGVLMGLGFHHSVERGCWPSQKRLAELAGIHRRSVTRALDSLEDRGLVKREKRLARRMIYRLAVDEQNNINPAYRPGQFAAKDKAAKAPLKSQGCDTRVVTDVTSVSQGCDIRVTPDVTSVSYPSERARVLNEPNELTLKNKPRLSPDTPDASINEAQGKQKKHRAAGKGSDLPSPPPGAIFRHLPTPPKGTAFEKIVWGAEKILQRRRVRAEQETDWNAEAQRRMERARAMKDGEL